MLEYISKEYDFRFAHCSYMVDLQDETGKKKKTFGTKWGQRRYNIIDAPNILKEMSTDLVDCFTSVQLYSKTEFFEGERHYAPIYLDFDVSSKEEFINVIEDVVKVYDFFTRGFYIDKEYIRLWFSGKKGIHILVDPRVAKITPHRELTYIYRNLAIYLKYELNLKTIDTGIYSIPRMWRFPNTIHSGTGLYVTELDISQLTNVEDIMESAKQQNVLYNITNYEDNNGNIYPITYSSELHSLMFKFFNDYEEQKIFSVPVDIQIDTEKTKDYTPECIRRIKTEFPFQRGMGHRATLVITNWYRTAGVSEVVAKKEIVAWAITIPQEKLLSHKQGEDKIRKETLSVIESVYKGDQKYTFRCARAKFIWADQNNKEAVYRFKCPKDCIMQQVNQKYGDVTKEIEAEIPTIHFFDIVKAEFTNKTIKTDISIIGKQGVPFIYPKKITLRCKGIIGESKLCQFCGLITRNKNEESVEVGLSRELLRMIDVNDREKEKVIKELSTVNKKCPKVEIIEEQYENIEQFRAIPQPQEEVAELISKEYVSRECFFIGAGLKLNESCKATGKLLTDPTNQKARFVISDTITVEDSLDRFAFSNEMYSKLKVFQAERGTFKDKFDSLHNELEPFLSEIINRKNIAKIFDLVYHSTIAYYFGNKFQRRGWLEAVIVGDTRTGKSKMAEGMIHYYRAMKLISAENLGRTGLVYNLQQEGSNWYLTWGEHSRMDRKGYFLDEAQSLLRRTQTGESNALEDMSSARSTGILQVSKVRGEQTNARTRLILLANTMDNRGIRQYSYGCLAIKGLVPRTEDISRFDMFATPASGEVPYDVINVVSKEELTEHPIYTRELCHNLVYFAWSRQPKQIMLYNTTIEKILDLSKVLAIKYQGSTADLPILVPEDLRFRLARMSISLATRLFSVDQDGKVNVYPEHAEVCAHFIQELLDTKVFGYDRYVRSYEEQKSLTELDYLTISNELNKLPDFLNVVELVLTLREWAYFQGSHLADAMGYNRDALAIIKNLLYRTKVYTITSSGKYKRTQKGTEFIFRYLRDKKITSVADLRKKEELGGDPF